ncbi:hypothetical protein [Hyphococcus luteus]|nr:hypothetical protein [Marinicaulis flavus]
MFTAAAAFALLIYAWMSPKVGAAVPLNDDEPEEAAEDTAAAPYR